MAFIGKVIPITLAGCPSNLVQSQLKLIYNFRKLSIFFRSFVRLLHLYSRVIRRTRWA